MIKRVQRRLLIMATLLMLPVAGSAIEAPEGRVYCQGEHLLEYRIFGETDWNAEVSIDGEFQRAMTSYSYFGRYATPDNFVVALLPENSSVILVFAGKEHYVEYQSKRWDWCN